jgi:hypothetical protein
MESERRGRVERSGLSNNFIDNESIFSRQQKFKVS